MKDELRWIGEKIVQNAVTIAQNVVTAQNKDYTDILDDSGMPMQERLEFRTEVIRYLGEALYKDLNSVTEKIVDWAKRAAEFSVQYHIPLTDSFRAISIYRTVIWDVFTTELEQQQFAAITMLDVSKIIDPLLDRVSSIYSEVYEQHNKRLVKDAYTALDKISVPVVPFVEGIAVIPIIGEINTHRANLLMEVTLSEGERLQLNTIIFDLSGVATIDTIVADQLLKIVNALNLTGIETIISGIRPEISQTIVRLGLKFGKTKTYSQLKQALHALGIRQEHSLNKNT